MLNGFYEQTHYETQHLGSSVGFRRALTQPTIFLNRAVLGRLLAERLRQLGVNPDDLEELL